MRSCIQICSLYLYTNTSIEAMLYFLGCSFMLLAQLNIPTFALAVCTAIDPWEVSAELHGRYIYIFSAFSEAPFPQSIK